MAHNQYLETQILGASPLELVRLMCKGALDCVREARRHLAMGDIRSRSRAITKAMEFVTELFVSLNFEAGGEISLRLSELYRYLQDLLLQAHLEQSDTKLAEAESLMVILTDMWAEVERRASNPDPEPNTPVASPYEVLMAGQMGSRSWSV